ncbi:Aste57867_4490 [Aphanomyces stellatus]|uniref:Aste57867_4490 protein n=1 Tax=Aphanomyces stellatus TaxID=120398 RepID=A0A485KFH5_9STRA|nr:hypothetical protein As57867_004477 [Aphanomyces stellatus]VFT81600.1 Aste57867_4490 [Aphanomyces stellatus]
MSNASLFYTLIGGAKVHIQEDAVGFWSPATAAINWCERDYAVSYFVAEFWNTLSNALYVVVGLRALLNTQRCPWQISAAALCCVFTGIFSGLFHASLQAHYQRIYEVFENGILVLFCHDRTTSTLVHIGVMATGVLVVDSFRFAELHLVFMIAFTIYRFLQIARDAPAATAAVHRAAMVTVGGFFCWLLDRVGCHVVSPMNPQLHAWWHLATAVALHYGFTALFILKSKVE